MYNADSIKQKEMFRIRSEDIKNIDAALSDIRSNPASGEMKRYRQHGGITTYDHCENVAKLSYLMNKRLHIGADTQVMLVGAFLHDLCLYDWHDKDPAHRLHGYTHAETARQNAVRYFHVGQREQDIIYCHMWPLNITRVPHSKEAWIVCMADKLCAVHEFCVNTARHIGSRH